LLSFHWQGNDPPRMRHKNSLLLYALLALYMGYSMLFYVACVIDLGDQYFHSAHHVHVPFQVNYENLTITTVEPDARQAGLAKGDVIEFIGGEPYGGQSQLIQKIQDASPGDTVQVGVLKRNGSHQIVSLHLAAKSGAPSRRVETLAVVGISMALPLFFLLMGYWVVAARPQDPNAWLILALLSFPEVFVLAPVGQSGIWLAVLGTWFETLQVVVPLALLLFGVYFPERWRWDKKVPYVKWILAAITLVSLVILILTGSAEYFHPAWLHWTTPAKVWVNRILNPVNLLCVVLYWVAIFDKLRTASTADARRRLRVLGAGSVISLGALLVVFVLLPKLGISPGFAQHPWLAVTGVLLSLLFPVTLAYVVVVQRALDVRILLRMGTKYALARATMMVLQFSLIMFLVVRFLIPALEKRQHRVMDLVITGLVLAGVIRLVAMRDSLSSRLQKWLDRRFFREAYSAEIVLSELSEQARSFTETAPLIETVARRISEVLHVPQVAVFLRTGGGFQLQQVVGLNFSGPLLLPEKSQTVQNLVENGPARLYRDDPDPWFLLADAEEKQTLNATHAELLLPLPGRQRLMGLMALGPKLSEEAYSPSDLRLLQSVASQTGLALEVSQLVRSLAEAAAQRERLNREIEIAHDVQQRLFPQDIPTIPGASLAGACRSAEGVGGDYYDVFQLEDGQLGLAIGDVSGKGISAALLMASLRASLRGMTLEGPGDLARLMQKLSRLVFEASASNRYATFFFATYNPQTHELKYVNAGHNPPVLLRNSPGKTPEVQLLKAGGLAVGLMPGTLYDHEQSVTLHPGDVLLAYTDGISEAMTADDEEWGEERMLAAVRKVMDQPAEEIMRSVFLAADEFTSGARQHDDMTLLILKLNQA
jgi:phosphoserine phosphatase RsbU/P